MNFEVKTAGRNRGRPCLLLGLVLAATTFSAALGQRPATDLSKLAARPAHDWVRDGVIYEIYPRAFSAEGNFSRITAQLDRLKHLGVTILWLMPIHQIGQENKKGTIGSPYAVRLLRHQPRLWQQRRSQTFDQRSAQTPHESDY